jgi:hypothetical protein
VDGDNVDVDVDVDVVVVVVVFFKRFRRHIEPGLFLPNHLISPYIYTALLAPVYPCGIRHECPVVWYWSLVLKIFMDLSNKQVVCLSLTSWHLDDGGRFTWASFISFRDQFFGMSSLTERDD